MKNNKKYLKSTCKHKVAFFTQNSPHWPVMWHASNFRVMEEIYVKKIVSGTHSTPFLLNGIITTNVKTNTSLKLYCWYIVDVCQFYRVSQILQTISQALEEVQ